MWIWRTAWYVYDIKLMDLTPIPTSMTIQKTSDEFYNNKKTTYYWKCRYLCEIIFVQEQKLSEKYIRINAICRGKHTRKKNAIIFFQQLNKMCRASECDSTHPAVVLRKLAHCFPEYEPALKSFIVENVHLSFHSLEFIACANWANGCRRVFVSN